MWILSPGTERNAPFHRISTSARPYELQWLITKWPSLRIWPFRMHCLVRKCLNFYWYFTDFSSNDPTVNKSWLVQVMAWRGTGDKPLPAPMLNQLFPAIWRTLLQWIDFKCWFVINDNHARYHNFLFKDYISKFIAWNRIGFKTDKKDEE